MDDWFWPLAAGLIVYVMARSVQSARRRNARAVPFVVTSVGQVITALPSPPPRLALPAPADILTPLGFERHCATLLRTTGWIATLTAGSGDQGVDVLARMGDISVVIQCKLYSKPIGNRAVQEAIAGRSYMGATHAAVVSNQPYTPAARELAHRTRVLLLAASDLPKLDRLLAHDRAHD